MFSKATVTYNKTMQAWIDAFEILQKYEGIKGFGLNTVSGRIIVKIEAEELDPNDWNALRGLGWKAALNTGYIIHQV